MNKAELERRVEARMENCEDALTKWPDSVAWLARYHELGEIRGLVQQLGPEVVQEPLSIDPEKLKQDILNAPIIPAQEIRESLREGASGPVTPEGPDPAQVPGDQAKGQQAPGKPAQQPKMGKLALRKLVRKLVKEGPKSYRDLELETGENRDALVPVIKWLCKREYIREFKPACFMISIKELAVKRAVAQALEDHPAGGPFNLVRVWALDIIDPHLNKDPACLPEDDVRAALEALEVKGKIRVKHHVDGSKGESNYQWKEPADRSRRRQEYTGTPDGSTPRSWTINLRKAILLYLKGETAGIPAFEIRNNLVLQPGFDARLELSDVEGQLRNLKKRGVVGEAEFKGQDSLWKAASR